MLGLGVVRRRFGGEVLLVTGALVWDSWGVFVVEGRRFTQGPGIQQAIKTPQVCNTLGVNGDQDAPAKWVEWRRTLGEGFRCSSFFAVKGAAHGAGLGVEDGVPAPA